MRSVTEDGLRQVRHGECQTRRRCYGFAQIYTAEKFMLRPSSVASGDSSFSKELFLSLQGKRHNLLREGGGTRSVTEDGLRRLKHRKNRRRYNHET